MAFNIEQLELSAGNIGDMWMLGRLSGDLENLDDKVLAMFDSARVEFVLNGKLEIVGIKAKDFEALEFMKRLLGIG